MAPEPGVPPAPPHRISRDALRTAGFAAAYAALLLASHGSAAAADPGSPAQFRPASGFLLAALLATGEAWRLRLLATALAANLAAHLASGDRLPAALGFWSADFAGLFAAYFLIRRIPRGAGFLDDLGGTVRFFTQVVPGGAAVYASAGAAAAALGLGTGWLRPLAAGFLAEAAGLAVTTPAILAWTRPDMSWGKGLKRNARFAACAGLALAVGYLTMSQPDWLKASVGRPLPYAIFPFLLWAALEFGARGAATVHVCLYGIGAWLDARGHGPNLLGKQLGMGLVGPLQWFPYAAAFCSLAPAVLVRRQRRIESELRLSGSRYGKLWGSKLIGIYITDLAGKVMESNDTFLAMIGMDRGALERGEIDVPSMATPEYRAKAEKNIAAFRAQGQLGPFEREWVLKDGRRLMSLVYAARMDEPDRALVMVMDVGELEAAREELRLRESRYRGLLSSSILGVFVSSLEGRIVEANDAFLAMIRRTREDLEAGRILSREMAPPGYLSGAQERIRQFEAEGRMGPFDREWILPDGSRLNTLFFATRLENGYALCMVFDTNELKSTKMKLSAVETRFKKLLDSNILCVAVAGEDLRIEEANDAFLALTGYSREDVETRSIHSPALAASHPPERLAAHQRELLANGKLPPGESEWTRKDGRVVPVYRGVTRLDDSNRWLTVALDLSATKRIQAELEAAKAGAVAANEAKSDFLAHMSHEIRTPLNGLLGMLFLLLDTRLDAEQERYAQAAREAGAHLLSLINRILDFSKIERGHMELDHRPFALDEVLEGALSQVREEARKKGIGISAEPDAGLPRRFAGDPVRLKQVLLNLVGNAVKFSQAGTVKVTARLLDRRGDRCRIGFEVSDQGPGIAPEAMAKLFRPFQQGDESLARKAGGTGLGLAISRELARRMGGDLEAESEPGAGSRFRFHIEADALDPSEGPRARAAAEPAGDLRVPSERPPVPDWGREPRVLVVDDHPVNLAVAAAMLRKLGCAVDMVHDGAGALAAAAAREYDLVFMDCQLPGMDGFETTRRLRAAEAGGRRVPIIALTAHAVAGMRERCLAAGMDDYLSKPFFPEEISRQMRKWLPGEGGAVPGAQPDGFAEGSLVDPERLKALDDGTPDGGEGRRRLVDLFLETGRKSLDRIRAEHGAGDAPALAKSLHRFKGSCATVGAVALAGRLKMLEEVLKTEGVPAAGNGLASLEALFSRTEKFLRNPETG